MIRYSGRVLSSFSLCVYVSSPDSRLTGPQQVVAAIQSPFSRLNYMALIKYTTQTLF
jgi:hypothetical protein